MKTKATVLSLDGKFATVRTERTSACEGCHKASDENGCSVCSLMGGNRQMQARARNTAGALVGDAVMIESNTSRMLWYAALVFLFPILATLLGVGIASLLHVSKTVLVAVGAILFVASFAVIFFYSRTVEKKRCDIEITEVISSQN